MPTAKILAFAGSTRTGSLNKKLIHCAAKAARSAGAIVTVVDLRDLAMPLYDGDLEEAEGLPAGAKKLKSLMQEHDGFLIASPEYNSSVTAVLKNALDWASRTETDDEPPYLAYKGKIAALLSASPGGLGGLRGLVHLRAILGNMGVIVLPDQVAISSAYEAFDEADAMKDARKFKQVSGLAASLVDFIKRHKATETV